MNKCLVSKVLLLHALVLLSRCIAESQSCSVEPSCIQPQPTAPLRESSLQDVATSTHCEIGCIEQHGIVLPLLHTDSLWPSLEFDALKEDCHIYQKIYECKMGCINGHENPLLTVNKCRDSCYAECEQNACNRRPCENMPCGRQCRKTYCRFGCTFYDTSNQRNKTYHTALPNVPSIIETVPTEGTQDRLYTVTPIMNSSVSSTELPVVAFIVKLSSPELNHVSYLWQRNLSLPIDLSPFACHRVSLSHAVVTALTPLDHLESLPFSPETDVCVPGLGGRPSQVTSLWVTYTEDLRAGFLGYAVATVSWMRPEGYQYLTSYTLNVYPDRESCGGRDAVYTFNNIDKELTSFSVEADSPNGLVKFGCSFLFELLAKPTEGTIVGPHVTKIATIDGPPPRISMDCERAWNKTSGNFDISVTWRLLPNTTQTSHITRFTLTPMSVSRKHNRTSHGPLTLTPQGGERKFHAMLHDYEPQAGVEYRIEVQSSKDSTYYWRRNPTPGFCVVSGEPHPPDFPRDIIVNSMTFDRSRSQLTFQIRWSHPHSSYGHVLRYELQVLVNEESTDLLSFPAGSSIVSVTSKIPSNTSVHCASVQMRTVSNFSLVSEWSEPLVLPLDDQCLMDTTSNTGKISMFYETRDSGAVRLLELGCQSDSALFGGNTQSGLTNTIREINQRVSNISSIVERDRSQLDEFQQVLARVEGKLDALLQLVSMHVHGNT